MPKEPLGLPSGIRPTDTLTVTQFASIFSLDTVLGVLERAGKATQRDRKLSKELVVYFVMMLALFRSSNHREVFRTVASAFDSFKRKRGKKIDIPSAAALVQARAKVGFEVMKEIFHSGANVIGTPDVPGCFFKHWRLMAIDGCLLDVAATEPNSKEFGQPKNQHKNASVLPQIRFVGLMEVGPHSFLRIEQGGYVDGEVTLARQLLGSIEQDMLVLADRNFYSFSFFNEIDEKKAAFVCRIQRGMKFGPERRLEDDSVMVTIYSSDDKEKLNGKKARLIQYRPAGSQGEIVFLITNILDPRLASAQELAHLYHERWEYENALDELKTHLCDSALTLRSKSPDLVKQEFWGTMMTYYVIRYTMFRAAANRNLDPDRLSFLHTVNVISRTLVKSGDFPP